MPPHHPEFFLMQKPIWKHAGNMVSKISPLVYINEPNIKGKIWYELVFFFFFFCCCCFVFVLFFNSPNLSQNLRGKNVNFSQNLALAKCWKWHDWVHFSWRISVNPLLNSQWHTLYFIQTKPEYPDLGYPQHRNIIHPYMYIVSSVT